MDVVGSLVERQSSSLPDDELVARVHAGDLTAFEDVMRRYNQRLYRVARAIVQDDLAAEDVMQQAYIQAFTHLDQFAGRSRLSTWLTRITIHEALGQRRKAAQRSKVEDAAQGASMPEVHAQLPDPEAQAYAAELRRLMESSIDALPEAYRVVFICRDVEGLSTLETAESLEIGEEAVKTRLHRARAMIRRDLFAKAGGASAGAFAFHLSRCETIVRRVIAHIRATGTSPAGQL